MRQSLILPAAALMLCLARPAAALWGVTPLKPNRLVQPERVFTVKVESQRDEQKRFTITAVARSVKQPLVEGTWGDLEVIYGQRKLAATRVESSVEKGALVFRFSISEAAAAKSTFAVMEPAPLGGQMWAIQLRDFTEVAK